MNSKRQRGTAVVEFALGLPVLLFMMLSIAQVGWWMSNYVVLNSAASAGARLLASERGFATPYTDTSGAVQSATGSLSGAQTVTIAVVSSGATTTCSGKTGDASCATALGTLSQPPAAGTLASVSISYQFAAPLRGSLLGLGSLMPSTMSANASVVVQ
ncbi:TadE/TadG family type IV pilus assembly protein [Paraburkholderia bannensis]|uniref:TadE/TadG family type IV pilus assembly protein n=1 Tax=Paraburkholderia bannensis TaxID=765414 RepID=UPI002AB7A282|nr:TadE/TadG family type IV pilus assembly protein [Paraburkholderia bannensis]